MPGFVSDTVIVISAGIEAFSFFGKFMSNLSSVPHKSYPCTSHIVGTQKIVGKGVVIWRVYMMLEALCLGLARSLLKGNVEKSRTFRGEPATEMINKF